MRHQIVFRAVLLVLSLRLFSTAYGQTVASIRLNEFIANNQSYTNETGGITDMLELFNTSAFPVDLGGCSLSDSNLFPQRFIFPPNTSIPANGYYRLTFATGPISNATTVPFGISANGGFLYFYSPALILIDSVEYGLQPTDYSLGRVANGTGPWVLCTPTLGGGNVAAPLGPPNIIKINEWLTRETSGDDFVELFNPTNRPVDIGGMYITDDSAVPLKHQIPARSFIGTGAMGGFLRFNADGSASTPKYPADELPFGLGSNDELELRDSAGLPVDSTPSFVGHIDDVSQGRLPDGSANIVFFPKINDYETQSPGDPNFLLFTNIYINELLAHTDPPLEDAVEIQNRTGVSLNINNWWLSNGRNNRKKYRLPVAAPIPVGGFRVIYEGFGTNVGFNSSSVNAVQPFTFNSARGDQVVLSQVDINGNLTGYIAYESFEPSANSISFGHYRTSLTNIGDYKFVAMSQRSFGVDDPNTVPEFRLGTGRTNPYPKIGPLVINEIMLAPSNTTFLDTNGFPVTGPNPKEEYIELWNITSQVVPLYDPAYPTNHWRLQSGVDFVFPLTNLAAGQFCLVVAFNPYTDINALNNFRTRFNVPFDTPIFGPWSGTLNNSGDSVELYRPDPVQLPPRPDAGLVPYIRIDKVNYTDGDINRPWPTAAAAGTGRTLQRKNSLLFGNDPINWAADNPTAGRASSSALQDTDGDGMPDEWEMAYGLNKFSSADAALDPDVDGITNLGEFVSGTIPTNSTSVLRVSQVVPLQVTNRMIRFLAYSNTTYTVQSRNALQPNSDWNRVANVPSAPTNRIFEAADTNAWSKNDRYYRVVAPATQ